MRQRQLEARIAVARPLVHPVERGSAQPHQYVTGLQRRLGLVAKFHDFRAAVLAEECCFHITPSQPQRTLRSRRPCVSAYLSPSSCLAITIRWISLVPS